MIGLAPDALPTGCLPCGSRENEGHAHAPILMRCGPPIGDRSQALRLMQKCTPISYFVMFKYTRVPYPVIAVFSVVF